MTQLTTLGRGFTLVLCAFFAGQTAPGAEPPKPAPSKMRKPTIGRAPATPVGPDLAIASLGADIRTCQIQVTWINKGSTPIDVSVTQRVEIHGQPLQQVVSTPHVVLQPGASFTYDAGPELVIHGAQEALAWIDVTNVLGEPQARRANNAATRTLTCGRAQPDLYPSNMLFDVKSTTTDSQGRTCKVLRAKPVILNIGTAPITTPFKIKVEADSGAGGSWVSYYEPTIDAMAVGQSLTLSGFEVDTCVWFVHDPQMPANERRRFRLTVDSLSQIHESKEDNNQNVLYY